MNNGTVSKSNQLERGKKTGETFESANIDQELTKMRLMTAKFMKDICIIFHVIGQNCNENFKLLTCCFCCWKSEYSLPKAIVERQVYQKLIYKLLTGKLGGNFFDK